MTAPAVSLIIPVYNESRVLQDTLRAVSKAFRDANVLLEVLVVDDGSSDATSSVAHAAEGQDLRVITHARRRGKGAAVRTGLRLATGRVAGFTDADLPVPAAELVRVAAACADQSDTIAVGRRQADPGSATRAPATRRVASAVVRRGAAWLHPPLVAADPWCPVKFGTAQLIKELGQAARCDGYFFDLELLWSASLRRATIVEVPVGWRDLRGQIEWRRVPVNITDALRCSVSTRRAQQA